MANSFFPEEILRLVQTAKYQDICAIWRDILTADTSNEYRYEAVRWLGRADRYFLLTNILHRKDAEHPWLYARCREVEAEPDDCLDLWARESYKSTIITFAGSIQEILNDPEITIGIFSHTKPTARKFLLQIKAELETNKELIELYPDVLYADPRNESVRWSEEKGLVVRRHGNPKESTIEAHGLVDGQPTGAHFGLLIYDDVVTLESVSTPDQVNKTTNAWALSDNLGARNYKGNIRKWHVGTRYSYADSYQYMLDKKILKPRIYPATDSGTVTGKPVFLTEEAWAKKISNQPMPILAAQMLQNPGAGNMAMFKREWLKYMDIRPSTLNVYVMTDPAGHKVGEDRTAIAVVGIDAQRNKWLLDGYNHKMSLRERWVAMRDLRKYWTNMPGVQLVKVGYERYGVDSDLDYFTEQMERERDHFEITVLSYPRDGTESKDSRVQRLEPAFRMGQFFLPMETDTETSNQARMKREGQSYRVFKPVRRVDENGNAYSLNERFISEYLTYPFSTWKDLIDITSRIYDIDPTVPVIIDDRALEPEAFID